MKPGQRRLVPAGAASGGALVAGCAGGLAAGQRAIGRHRAGAGRRAGLAAAEPVTGWTTGCATAADRDPPDVPGVWGDVVSQVVRLHRRKRFHKQRLLEVFRELRRSTAAMPDGVVILNAQWEIVWFNRMAGRLLGLRRRVDLRHAHHQPGARSGARAATWQRASSASRW